MHETSELFYNLEAPAADAEFPADRHLVRGWLVPKPGQHFVDVRAQLRGRIYPAVHGLPRPDLADVFKLTGIGSLAGFEISLDFEPGANELVLEALSITGYWQGFAQVVYRATARTL